MSELTRRKALQWGATSLFTLGLEATGANAARAAAGLTMPCLALSSDGVLLAAPASGKGVVLFEYATGKKSQVLTVPAEISVQSLAFRGAGSHFTNLALDAPISLVAAGGSDGSVRLWNTLTSELLGVIAAHKESVTELLFSPDGKVLLTASGNETRFKIWNTATRALLNEVPADAIGVGALAISPDGKTLAVGGSDRTAHIRVYDISNPNRTKRFSSYLRGGHDLSVTSLAFSPNGKHLVSGSLDSKVCFWELAERKLLTTITEHTKPVISVAYHPDGGSVASGSLDKTVRRWEAPSGKAMGILGKHEGEVYTILFAPDGKTLVSGGQDGPVRVGL